MAFHLINNNLDPRELEILKQIEEKIKRKIQKIDSVRKIEKFPDNHQLIEHQVGYVVENRHIIQLGLSNLFLTDLPEEIGYFEFLEELDLINNMIMKVPKSICNLKNLKILNLYNNQISEFIEDCTSLNRLQILNLGLNKLHNLPDSIGELKNLIELNVCNNKLKEIPKSIGNCVNLETLNLDFNQIVKLDEEISNLKSLKILRLASNQIEELPNSIGKLKNLRELILIQNRLNRLPTFIGELTNLKVLNLRYNYLSDLPETIKNLKNLEYLDISKNNFPRLSPCIKYLQDFLNSKKVCIDNYVLKNEPKSLKTLNNFEFCILNIDSGEITVSDPLIGINYDSTFITRKGNWIIYLVFDKNNLENLPAFEPNSNFRIGSIIAVHEDYLDLKLVPEDWTKIIVKFPRNIVGILDTAVFYEKTPFKGKLEKMEEKEQFQRDIKKIIYRNNLGIYLDKGFVLNLESIENYDSNMKYMLFTYKNNRGFVVILWLDFTHGEVFEDFNNIK